MAFWIACLGPASPEDCIHSAPWSLWNMATWQRESLRDTPALHFTAVILHINAVSHCGLYLSGYITSLYPWPPPSLPAGSHRHDIWEVERKSEPYNKLPTTHLSLEGVHSNFCFLNIQLKSKCAFIAISTKVRCHSCYLGESCWAAVNFRKLIPLCF